MEQLQNGLRWCWKYLFVARYAMGLAVLLLLVHCGFFAFERYVNFPAFTRTCAILITADESFAAMGVPMIAPISGTQTQSICYLMTSAETKPTCPGLPPGIPGVLTISPPKFLQPMFCLFHDKPNGERVTVPLTPQSIGQVIHRDDSAGMTIKIISQEPLGARVVDDSENYWPF